MLLTLFLLLLFKGCFLCCLLGGYNASHGVQHLAFALPITAHEFIAAGLLLLLQCLALLLLPLVLLQLGRVLLCIVRLAPVDVVLPPRHVWLDGFRLALRYLLPLRGWLVLA